jgi:tetratricopeptide (TPR) repeat protein
VNKKLEIASKKIVADNCQKAIKIYEDILNKEPKNIEALYNLAKCSEKLGDYQRALICIDKVIAFADYKSRDYYVMRGNLYFEMAMETKANEEEQLRFVTLAIKDNTDYLRKAKEIRASLYYKVGEREYERGRFQTAISYFELAQKDNPDFSNAEVMRAKAYFKKAELMFERGEQTSVLEIINDILKYEIVKEKALILRSKVFFRRGEFYNRRLDFEQALKYYRLSFKDHPVEQTTTVLLNLLLKLGEKSFKNGDYLRAERFYDDAIRYDDSNRIALTGRARAKYTNFLEWRIADTRDAALKALKRIDLIMDDLELTLLNPQEIFQIQVDYSEALVKAGDFRKALSYIEKSLSNPYPGIKKIQRSIAVSLRAQCFR